MAAELSKAEQIFALRMLPHLKSGKSFEDAASAVLDDDARIFSTFAERSHDYFVARVNDHSGRSYRTRETAGDLIAKEITETVYRQLRRAA